MTAEEAATYYAQLHPSQAHFPTMSQTTSAATTSGSAMNAEEMVDVRMIVEAEIITIIFKDNGAPFDPLKEREDPKEFGSIAVVEAISMSISYDYIIGMNRTVVQLNFEKHENERNISRGAKL